MPATAKLTIEQRKEVVAKHAEGVNYSQLAKEYGVTPNTIKNYVKQDDEFADKCEQVKKEAEQNIVEQLYDQRNTVIDIVKLGLSLLADPETYQKAGPQAIATTIAILIDKFTQLMPKENEELQRAKDILGGLDGVIS